MNYGAGSAGGNAQQLNNLFYTRYSEMGFLLMKSIISIIDSLRIKTNKSISLTM